MRELRLRSIYLGYGNGTVSFCNHNNSVDVFFFTRFDPWRILK